MTYAQIAQMVESIGLPFAYGQFNEPQDAPFIIFYYPENEDMYADGLNYTTIAVLVIEFYSAYRDFKTEQTIENVLRENKLSWRKIEERQADEKAYGIQYTTEVLINGE